MALLSVLGQPVCMGPITACSNQNAGELNT